MSFPIAVLISDIHFNINTLTVAKNALVQAVSKANELDVGLVIAGDLHDTKANLRGECVSAIIACLKQAAYPPTILVGNHDLINEKSDKNSLEFLEPYANIVTVMGGIPNILSYIPYQNNPDNFKNLIDKTKGIVIMHQGVHNAYPGHYFQDSTAVPKEWLDGKRVFSGHYHARQDIKCGETGLLTYIGNPYTLGFGEAQDPKKGFLVLMDDGSYEFYPTNLRKHKVLTVGWDDKHGIFWPPIFTIDKEDIVWIKVEGTKEQLKQVTKEWLQTQFTIPGSFKLDLIPIDASNDTASIDLMQKQDSIFDSLIDAQSGVTEDFKAKLKRLWKSLV